MPHVFGTRASYVLTIFGGGKQITFAERIMGDPCFVDDYHERVVSAWGQINTYDIEPQQLQMMVPPPESIEPVRVPYTYPQLQTVSTKQRRALQLFRNCWLNIPVERF